MEQAVIKAEKISFSYPGSNWTFGPLDLEITGNVLTGIIGPNGSGKSTLLSILSKHIQSSGKINFSGKPIQDFTSKEFSKLVGFLPQKVTTQFDFTVKETVEFGRYSHAGTMGFLSEKDEKIVEKCLKETDLEKLEERMLSELSGGERQRVFLASVLAQEPEILLLDEPTTALDIHHQISFYNLICECVKKEMTVVLVTHDLTMASQFCNQLILMSDGKIIETGSPEQVIRQNLISDIYDENVKVAKHPDTGRPVVLPDVGKRI